ncbi:YheC/YheD family protein [Bacillus sp. CGMCC 1.16607]|uniref:YheC/YheD family endospore coat-associated protein n=1 Tax=Bacillus sp. CGMCC 1.16607 TaxID=3351842 RepID=UPI00362A52E5
MNSFSPITLVPHTENKTEERLIYISKPLFEKWKLTTNGIITICIGKHFIRLKVLENNINVPEIMISEELLTEWYLPIQTYHFVSHYIFSKQTLYLAPVIGLLTEVNEEDLENPHFRSVHSFSEELEYVTKVLGGLFYVFPLQIISDDYVTGFYYNDGKWCKSKLPIPDVIYNRIHSRRIESSESFRKFRNQILIEQIPMFNDRFLSKWEVYDVLITEEHLQPYLPVTTLYSKKNLDEMLQKYKTIFLKPIHGSQGRNIIRIINDGEQYQLQFSYFKDKQDRLNINDQEELHEKLTPYINNNTYLIQQGIPFIKIQNRLMDFRVLCHKNNQNSWNVTSVVARLSAEKQFVSNIARGGEMMKPLKALSLFFETKTAQQQLAFMKELALEFASLISQNAEGLTGELGIDMGIDTDGNPWMIEVNSKPSKNFEEQEIKIRPSAKSIVSYCFRLALEYVNKKEEG